jgi:quercetin dioxygenase-like cupin family protein
MTTDRDWQHVPPGEGTVFDWANDLVRVKTPAPFTDGAASVVEDTLKPGFELGRHHHRRMTEIFYVLDGEVTFTFDERTLVASPGTVVNVAPNLHHAVSCPAGGRLITVFVPGGFDLYLSEVAELVASGRDDEQTLLELGHRYDIWPDQ